MGWDLYPPPATHDSSPMAGVVPRLSGAQVSLGETCVSAEHKGQQEAAWHCGESVSSGAGFESRLCHFLAV